MNIEHVICPGCNSEFRVNVPPGKDIVDVFIAAHIFASFTKRHDHRLLCPRCGIEVFVKYG